MSRCSGRTDNEDFRQTFRSYLRLNLGMLQQRFGFRAKDKHIIHLAIEQRFDSKPVTCQKQMLAYAVPDSKGKDSVQLLSAVRPPFHVGVEQNLRVTLGQEAVPALFELAFELACIIQFAVIHKGIDLFVMAGDHRLCAVLGVNNAQSAVSKGTRS
ncbi:hypothetical protein D3C75_1053810 [compost metagenome]